MAISAHDTPEKLQVVPANTPRKDCSLNFGKHTKIDIGSDRILDNARKRVKQRVPFLRSDKIQLLSRVTEKRYHGNGLPSSYPLAFNIYKANSDEFKTPKRTKKMKKSVLTLPNDPAPMPQTCTVSDMNDSEYYNLETESMKSKSKKKGARKIRTRRRNYEYYDPDGQRCSDFDCSSTEIIKKYGGDGKRDVKSRDLNGKSKNDFTSQDMWTVLRNINRFQFRPSPNLSDDSLGMSPKKKSTFVKRHANLPKGTRLIETCRTAEVSYVANFEFDNNSPQRVISPSISGDRITVIEKGFQQNKNELKDKTNQNLLKIAKPRSPLTIRERYNRYNPRPLNFKAAAIKEYNKYVPFSKCLPEVKHVNPRYRATSSTKLSTDSSNCLRTKDNSGIMESSEKCTTDFGGQKSNDKVQQQSVNRVESPKPRQVPTMPKITSAEIKRRLNSYRFPLVILDKDQISSPLEVINIDPPQFDGLDKHIWPFMVEWNKKGKSEIDQVTNNLRKLNLEVHKKLNNATVNSTLNKRNENRRLPQQGENSALPLTPKKSRPIRHFKDKMLKFLYKKPSPSEPEVDKEEDYVKIEKVDACTDPIIEIIKEPKNQKEVVNSLEKAPNRPTIFGPNRQKSFVGRAMYHNGSKAGKWDFIENIINKIRNGVYYTHEEKKLNSKPGEVDFIGDIAKPSSENSVRGSKEVDGQLTVSAKRKKNDLSRPSDLLTVLNRLEANYKSPVTEIEDVSDVKIPGFDDNVDILRELEINSLTFNTVAVKHRLTNVVVQFDITVPSKPCDIVWESMNSSSFVPLTITESNTKVFKCNTKIVNAILPAELCSMIPRLMRDFINSEAHLALFPTPTPATQVQCASSDLDLYTICNVDPCNVLGLYDIPNTISYDILSPALKQALDGKFAVKVFRPCVCCTLGKFVINHRPSVADLKNLLPTLPSPIPFILWIVNPLDMMMPKANSEEEKPTVKALTIPREQNVALDVISHPQIMKTIRTYFSFNLDFNVPPYIHPLRLKYEMVLTEIEGLKRTISTTVSAMKIPLGSVSNQFFNIRTNGFKKNASQIMLAPVADKVVTSDKVITEVLPVKRRSKVAFALRESDYIAEKPEMVCDLLNKTPKKELKSRKHRYIKLYKKCKSTSNLSGERSCTPLSKVTNLEEFFQALGSAKTMSCVFDGISGKKIMASINELKTWISEITPRQAMLVLLLTNKKETRNLIRFRPILLQGIAVNRITRATELDMEIEVIETENVGLTKEYEGISYVPASIENQDCLLEELCWIAKTTASDYHKVFDESSEKLLKSLIQKRKQLNPSYLRVVARYVGLGLLKRKNYLM